jgi:rhodanese-related sulfurtransferase
VEVTVRGWVKVLLIMVLLPILVGGAVLFIGGRALAFEILQRRIVSRFPEVQWIGTEDLARWAQSARPQALVLDARTGPEFALSHLKGALLIDPYKPSLNPLRSWAKNGPIVVYSSAGYRGARVASWLGKQGYSNVRNLAGGVFRWANEGRPLFKEDDRPTAVVHPYDDRWGLLVDGRYRAEAGPVEKRSAAP